MLATTFGTFMADANSVELRQLAIRSNGLDGGPDDSQLVAKAIIKSAIWIRNNSQDNQIIATNYASNGTSSVAYLVSVATQRSVLIEPLDYVSADPLTYISEDSIINNFAKNDKLRSDFSKQPNGSTAKALAEVGVTYFLFETTDAQITSSDLCAKNEVWRCDYKNEYSVVIKFLDQN